MISVKLTKSTKQGERLYSVAVFSIPRAIEKAAEIGFDLRTTTQLVTAEICGATAKIEISDTDRAALDRAARFAGENGFHGRAHVLAAIRDAIDTKLA